MTNATTNTTLTKLAVAAAVLATFGVANAADIVGSQSTRDGGDYIMVGKSNVPFGPHKSNRAGIGVSNTFLFSTRMKVDFEGLSKAKKTTHVDLGNTRVYQLHNPIVNTNPFHRQLGNFNFVKVGTGDVWFGEWSRNDNPSFAGRQVYYVGDRSGTTIPNGGTARYSVKGINKFTGNNLMSGTLTANFRGNGSLKGTISNATASLRVAANKIDSQGAFSGTAYFNGETGGNQSLKGHFFGNRAAALAGIATFNNLDYNTAFGGTKITP